LPKLYQRQILFIYIEAEPYGREVSDLEEFFTFLQTLPLDDITLDDRASARRWDAKVDIGLLAQGNCFDLIPHETGIVPSVF
jgi:hypothetical protein